MYVGYFVIYNIILIGVMFLCRKEEKKGNRQYFFIGRELIDFNMETVILFFINLPIFGNIY